MTGPSPPDSSPSWRERFLSTTRGRIVAGLRGVGRTPAELAHDLAISPNAVRGHLASLARDGLVEVRRVRRRGVGKPPQEYTATAAAEALFPKAYEAILAALLDALVERVGSGPLAGLLRDVGRGAARKAEGDGDPLERAVSLMADLGAEVRIEEADEGLWFRGRVCPLSGLVSEHPELCGMVAALLGEVTGLPVLDRCRRDAPGLPSCAFLALGSAADSAV